MTSRLDRLVTLLDTGSTHHIRETAAHQLADVQKQHPDDLFNLLNRIVPFIRSKKWDTRRAATRAIGGILDNAAVFDPNEADPESGPAELEPGVDVKIEIKTEIKTEPKIENGSPVKTEPTDDAGEQRAGSEEPIERQTATVKQEADSQAGTSSAKTTTTHPDDLLSLDTLDVSMIMARGKPLLGSAGREYDYKLASLSATDRHDYQKRSLGSRIGLQEVNVDSDLLSDRDLGSPRAGGRLGAAGSTALDGSGDTGSSTPSAEANLSKRQLAMMRRRRKRPLESTDLSKLVISGPLAGPPSAAPETATPAGPTPDRPANGTDGKAGGIAAAFSLDRGPDDDSKLVTEFKGGPVEKVVSLIETEDQDEWPLERLCDILAVDLFDPSWEIRHGAAMALREIIRTHGRAGGRRLGQSRKTNEARNQRWLDDLACRLCAVFMLDRFGDYVSDSVVVPVRETAGQCLGAVLQHMAASQVGQVYGVLRQLIVPTDRADKPGSSWERAWQPMHGAMLGLRYLVAVRADLLTAQPELLQSVLSTVMNGLGDGDDDVRAVSAATLIPIAREVVTLQNGVLGSLVAIVWDCLSNLGDDLSASTGSMMDLLAKLCGFRPVLDAMRVAAAADPERSFDSLVPRLFPFLRHTITSVRMAVLRALVTFLDMDVPDSTGWVTGRALRLIVQNVLVERNEGVLGLSLELWNRLIDHLVNAGRADYLASEFAPHVEPVVRLTVGPVGLSRHHIPMSANLFLRPSGSTFSAPVVGSSEPTSPRPAEPAKKRRRSEKKTSEPESTPVGPHNVDAPMMAGDVDLVGPSVFVRCRLHAAIAVGHAIAAWPVHSRVAVFGQLLAESLASTSASTRVFAAAAVEEYARRASRLVGDKPDQLLAELKPILMAAVTEPLPAYYRDIKAHMYIVRAQCQAVVTAFREADANPAFLPSIAPVVQGDENANRYAFSLVNARTVLDADYEKLRRSLTPAQRVATMATIDDARASALDAIEEAQKMKDSRDVRVKAAAGCAIVAAGLLPPKPGPVIKAMMDSVKSEENGDLQRRSAAAVGALVQAVEQAGKMTIGDKVVNNLIQFACMETAETPEFGPNSSIGPGILSLRKEEDIREHADAARYEAEARRARITRRGAKEALEQIVVRYGPDLFDRLPVLKTHIDTPIRTVFETDELPATINEPDRNPTGQRAIDALSTLRALVARFDKSLHPFVESLYPFIARAVRSRLAVLRYAAAKCLATVCSVMTVSGITLLIDDVLPALANAAEVQSRQGAVEAVYHLLHVMEDRILPYVVFLIVPLLGRMSDPDKDVRLIATTAFAGLVKLVPLEAGIPDPPGLSARLLEGRDRERKFVAQMLDPRKIEPFTVPVAIRAELRPYQQDGVNWLAFLNRFHLHGILCDDMGLGKTLQTICIVASDHHLRTERFAETGAAEDGPVPSLIVCPPTLSGHWQQEINTYAPFLKTVAYVGPPAERGRVRERLAGADVVITSYDICRNDIAVLGPLSWNYCVLDEGHLIKNAHTKTTAAVKRLGSNHRLILSGTPIQNNVLELWSLFDFLMPGFLGTEKVFQDRFAKPIAASRHAKSSSKEQEAGALAIEALHKQVLPFLLRRLKEEVLDDLPPKIIQNYYCDLSDLQRKLFDDFSRKEGRAIADKAGSSSNDRESKQHIFQALQYMRKLCNSPAFVMKPTHKAYNVTQQYLAKLGSSLADPAHAPKLRAVRDLLLDCGIGLSSSGPGQDVVEAAVSQHRALVFCQMKEMLDMVEQVVLRQMLPSVSFMRLDGSVEAKQRQTIVNQFNSDPSIDVLLLTTSVGGLGLNLTGADTVIFVEHDWNPQKDMQAMDRAHRIGQKKVVNVYRIVTRGTLEEKILSLQRFKIDVASTVVNQQNAGLATMETDQLLELFDVSSSAAVAGDEQSGLADSAGAAAAAGLDISEDNAVDATGAIRKDGKRGVLDELDELWDESQYEEEFNIDAFLERMRA